jgi:hypothetical protein
LKKLFLLLLVAVTIGIIALAAFLALRSAPSPSVLPEQSSSIDSLGGTFTTKDLSVSLTFPPGALSEKTEITVKSETANYSDEGVVPGSAYQFGPDVEFAKPVSLTMKYDKSKLPASAIGNLMCIAKFNGTAWTPIFNSTVDQTQNTVTVEITSFTAYAPYVFYASLEPRSIEGAAGKQTTFGIRTNLPSDKYRVNVGSLFKIASQVDLAPPLDQEQITLIVHADASQGATEEYNVQLIAKTRFLVDRIIGTSGGNSQTYKLDEFLANDIIATLKGNLTVSGQSIVLQPAGERSWQVNNGSTLTINCFVTGISNAEKSQLVYVWTCSCRFGYLDVKDAPPYDGSLPETVETTHPVATYVARADAADGSKDDIAVTVYKVEGSSRTQISLFPRDDTERSIDIYNPTTVYQLCSDSLGTKYPSFGSGGDWDAWVVGHGNIISSFRARMGDLIHIKVNHAGNGPSDLYLRVGKIGDPTIPGAQTQLLLSKSDIHDGLVIDVKIEIGEITIG